MHSPHARRRRWWRTPRRRTRRVGRFRPCRCRRCKRRLLGLRTLCKYVTDVTVNFLSFSRIVRRIPNHLSRLGSDQPLSSRDEALGAPAVTLEPRGACCWLGSRRALNLPRTACRNHSWPSSCAHYRAEHAARDYAPSRGGASCCAPWSARVVCHWTAGMQPTFAGGGGQTCARAGRRLARKCPRE